MHIHEYQAKNLLKNASINIPKSILITSNSEVEDACHTLGGNIWVIKAQAHTGSRGKGGGVIICNNIKKAQMSVNKILSQNLVTPQTDAKGLPVNSILIEENLKIERAIYLSLLIDRSSQKINIITSTQGGGDIEEVALKTPEKIVSHLVEIKDGLTNTIINNIANSLNIDNIKFSKILSSLYNIFIQKNCQLIEINPLIISNNQLIALDCKIEFDDNALFKQPEIVKLKDTRQENPKELEAKKYGLSYISLDGNIGCMVNGAGLAMATMDLIEYHGGSPLNFLDVGGGTTSEKVAKAFEIIQSEAEVKAILVNIFGGIVRCDLIAEGILQSIDDIGLKVPLVVRLEGTNSQEGLEILSNSSHNIVSENDLTLAAKQVVKLAMEKK